MFEEFRPAAGASKPGKDAGEGGEEQIRRAHADADESERRGGKPCGLHECPGQDAAEEGGAAGRGQERGHQAIAEGAGIGREMAYGSADRGVGVVDGLRRIDRPDAKHRESEGDHEQRHGDDERWGLELLAVEEAEGTENGGESNEEDDDAGAEDQAVNDGEAAVAVGLLHQGKGFEWDDRKHAWHDIEDQATEEGEEEDDGDGVRLFIGVQGFVIALGDDGLLLFR